MPTRWFKNNNANSVQFPSLGVEIRSGETGEVEWPEDQPAPFGLEQVTKKAAKEAATDDAPKGKE